MEALVYTKAYKLQWIYEKIRFLFEEPLPFVYLETESSFEPFFLISVENFKYGELHLLSKLLQVGIITWNLHTFILPLLTAVMTCHLDTSLQLRSIFIQISLYTPILLAKLAKGMGHNYYGEPAWPNDLLYIFPVVILGTIAGTSFPYFKYSVFFSLGIFRLLPSESSLDT
ncbi:hypothetical protein ACJX0J_026612 [Zea mays]